ncbi:MAG: L-rhamnose isomerase [Verrucomicrobiota bacterium]
MGVATPAALDALAGFSISLQCWQGDDVTGFEPSRGALGGGLAVTGAYPGRARTPDELRADLEVAYRLIPGRHRLSLHAMYGEFGGQAVDRDAIGPEHFQGWIAWAREQGVGLDFNPTCFAHPRAAGGLTLAHPEASVRRFWIEHVRRSREIAAALGRAQGSPCVHNIWVPDGFKDTPADRWGPRERLGASLDAARARAFPAAQLLDAVEPKLFGLGAESCTVGSYEFLYGYAMTRRILLCLDAGHFHPTETLGDKLSGVMPFLPGVLLHLSRGVRWDSDHVVTFTDELQAVAREVVAGGQASRVHLGLDYFDATLHRVAAWVIGTRNVLRALLVALLEPPGIRAAEREGDLTARLALQEEARALPFGAVWDRYCELHGTPPGEAWLEVVRRHEREVTSRR